MLDRLKRHLITSPESRRKLCPTIGRILILWVNIESLKERAGGISQPKDINEIFASQ